MSDLTVKKDLVTVQKTVCENYFLQCPGHFWTNFVINPKGDLFIYGDWGYYCYGWRSFGESFKKFLIDMTDDYLIAKLESNASVNKKVKINGRQKEELIYFFKELKTILKAEIDAENKH